MILAQTILDSEERSFTISLFFRLSSAQEKIDATVSKLEVCRHTFQGLVLGSGVHWAADDALKQTVLQLGKPIQEILEDSNK